MRHNSNVKVQLLSDVLWLQVVLTKIYPAARRPEDIPENDIVMVMDCDHMVKPEIFNKMAPCMRDRRVGTVLVPQWFHNLCHPVRLSSCFERAWSALPRCRSASWSCRRTLAAPVPCAAKAVAVIGASVVTGLLKQCSALGCLPTFIQPSEAAPAAHLLAARDADANTGK